MIAERNSATAPRAPNSRPLQNRVDPFGELHAVAERGAMMGNRGGRLHRERVENRGKRLTRARLGDLPEGAMIARDGRAYAVRSEMLWPWSFAGYGAPLALEPGVIADVLTPPSTVAALKGGYRPMWAEALNASP